MAERNRPHRHQRGKGDGAGKESPSQSLVVEAGQPVLPHHRQGQRQIHLRLGTIVQPLLQGLGKPHQQDALAPLIGHEEAVQHGLQPHAPLLGRGGIAYILPGVLQRPHQGQKPPQQLAVQTTDLVQRLDVRPRAGMARHIAQQHALQSEPPAVLRHGIVQFQRLPLRRVQPPADAALLDPAAQLRQLFGFDAKTLLQRRHLQQIQHLGHRQARLRQVQQELHGGQQRLVAAALLVGHRERNEARVLRRIQPEHRLDVRRIGGDVRHHHDHVPRLQRGIRCKGGQQLVMKHLHLALRTVADLEADGAVTPGINRRPAAARLGQRRQIEDILLQLQKQCIGRLMIDEDVRPPVNGQQTRLRRALLLVVLGQQANEIPPLPPPGSQQRLTMCGQVGQCRIDARSVGVSAAKPRQPLPLGHDIAPVMATGVLHAHQHLTPAPQGGQHLQRLAGHGRDPEDHHAARQPGGPFGIGRRAGVNEALVDRGAIVPGRPRAHIGQQLPPEQRLPACVFRQGLAGLIRQRPGLRFHGVRCLDVASTEPVRVPQPIVPVGPILQPVGPVDLILVEQVSQLGCQLMQTAQLRILFQETPQRLEDRLCLRPCHQRGQQPHQSPGQQLLAKG